MYSSDKDMIEKRGVEHDRCIHKQGYQGKIKESERIDRG